jgi:hypothetical protein
MFKNKYIAPSLLLALLTVFMIDCKKEKKDDNSMLLGAALIASQGGGIGGSSQGALAIDPKTGAANTVLPRRLSVIGGSSSGIQSSIQTIRLVNGIVRQAATRTDAQTDGIATKADYAEDKSEVIYTDPITSSLKEVDTMFQQLDLTGYKYLIDKGPVKVKFSSPQDPTSASTSGAQKQGQAQKETWIVEAKSTNGTVPIVIKVWGTVPGMLGDKAKAELEVIIEKAPTYTTDASGNQIQTSNAVFTLKTKMSGKMSMGGGSVAGSIRQTASEITYSATMIVKGKDENNKVSLQISQAFKLSMGDQNMEMGIALNVDSNKSDSTGKATIYSKMPSTDSTGNFTIADEKLTTVWNANYIYSEIKPPTVLGQTQQNTTIQKVLFKRGEENTVVYSYGLYDTEGKRRYLRTGFPIKTSDGKEGWASQWGVSTYNKETGAVNNLADGSEFTEVKFDGSTGETYTVTVIPGTAFKQYVQDIPKADLKDIPLNVYPQEGGLIIVEYDGTNFQKKKTCTLTPTNSCTDTSGVYTPGGTSGYDYFYMAGQKSGGGKSINYYKGKDSTGNDFEKFTAYIYEEVNKLDTALTFYEYSYDVGSQCYTAASNNQPFTATPTTYTLGTNLTLKDSSGNIVTDYKYGLKTTQLTFATGSYEDCSKIYGSIADVTYSWNYGGTTNPWSNKYVIKSKSTGEPLIFENALEFTVKVAGQGAASVSYYNFGQLSVPWEQDPNADPNDYMNLYKPAITVPNGMKLTTKEKDAAGNMVDKNYYVKWLFAVKNPKKTTETAPSALVSGIAEPLANPDTIFTEADKTVDLGAEPATDKVCIVDGEPVGADGKPVKSFNDSVCKK